MEPAEFIELIVTTREGIGGHVSNFVVVLFAYLVMTYFVAEKLSRFQVWGLSAIYSVYEFLPANAALQDIQTHGALVSQFYEQHPAEAAIYIVQGQSYPIVFGLVALASWGLSIAFMVQRRRGKGGQGDA